MLKRGTTVFLPCRLSQGGFSSERVFRVTLPDATDHVGVAPVHYCWTEDGKRLGDDFPPREQRIPGWVEAYVIADRGPLVRIETPDGEAYSVEVSLLKQFPADALERYSNVPV